MLQVAVADDDAVAHPAAMRPAPNRIGRHGTNVHLAAELSWGLALKANSVQMPLLHLVKAMTSFNRTPRGKSQNRRQEAAAYPNYYPAEEERDDDWPDARAALR